MRLVQHKAFKIHQRHISINAVFLARLFGWGGNRTCTDEHGETTVTLEIFPFAAVFFWGCSDTIGSL